MLFTQAQREQKFNDDVQHHLNVLFDLLDDNRETFNSQRIQDTLTLVKHAKNEWEGGMGSNKNAEPLNRKLWTTQDFKDATGYLPNGDVDDLDRCNCIKAGQAGHRTCGICKHNQPLFLCPDCIRDGNLFNDSPLHPYK